MPEQIHIFPKHIHGNFITPFFMRKDNPLKQINQWTKMPPVLDLAFVKICFFFLISDIAIWTLSCYIVSNMKVTLALITLLVVVQLHQTTAASPARHEIGRTASPQCLDPEIWLRPPSRVKYRVLHPKLWSYSFQRIVFLLESMLSLTHGTGSPVSINSSVGNPVILWHREHGEGDSQRA